MHSFLGSKICHVITLANMVQATLFVDQRLQGEFYENPPRNEGLGLPCGPCKIYPNNPSKGTMHEEMVCHFNFHMVEDVGGSWESITSFR